MLAVIMCGDRNWSSRDRNREMLLRLLVYRASGYDVRVEAFHSNIAKSKGTKNMIDQAVRALVHTQVTT